MSKPTILVTAYAVNPYKGSEDGMGWNMILQIARFQKVIAITRENNQDAIDKFISENNIKEAENIQFEYFDTPYYTRFWKKGGRGALLYFYMWQYAVASWINKKNWDFDIVHNLNFHNDWTPSFLWKTGKPFVWGPVGHHPKIPKPFLKQYGKSAVFKERLRWFAKSFFWKIDPFLKKTKKSARHIFMMNSEVQKVLNLPESHTSILPSVATEQVFGNEKIVDDCFNILSVGRFVPLKGFDVTVNAFAAFYFELPEAARQRVKLTLVGRGPERPFIERLIKSLKIESAVQIIPWIDRDKLSFIYQTADLFFFPSHEGAGMVVAEAMSYGIPVLCFENCGPGEFVDTHCGVKIHYENDYQLVIDSFKNELVKLYHDQQKLKRLSRGALRQFRTRFTWNLKGEMFRMVYHSILHNKLIETSDEANKADHIYSPAK